MQLVAAGAPIAAVPLAGGIGGFKNQQGFKGQIPTGHTNPSFGSGLLPPPPPRPLNTYSAPALGSSYGTPPVSGGLGLAPPIGGGLGLAPPISLPPAPILPPVQNVQHMHHHLYNNKKPVPYNPPPPVYTKNPVYSPPAPVYNRPTAPAYNPIRPNYNPSQQIPAYSNPPPSYSGLNGRDTCVCVPVQQCPSYDIVGRVNDYQLDPRNVKSNITAIEDDQLEKSRRRRRHTFGRRQREIRQTIVGDDSITVVSSDSTGSPSFPSPPFSPPSVPVNPDVSNPESTNTDVSTPIIGVPIPEGNGEGVLGSTPTAVSYTFIAF